MENGDKNFIHIKTKKAQTRLWIETRGLIQLKDKDIYNPEKYNKVPGITELDKNNNLNMVSEVIGSISLGIHDDTILRNKITIFAIWDYSHLILTITQTKRFRLRLTTN